MSTVLLQIAAGSVPPEARIVISACLVVFEK